MNQIPRRALVTGGGSGIGLAIARALMEAGHTVTIAGRTEFKLRETGLPYVVMDVIDPASIAEGVRKSGRIDIFVANAGGAETAPALKTPREMWQRMLALDLTSIFDCAQAAVPQMVERGWGRFIAIASTASLRGVRYGSAYAAAKHGVLGFVRSLALELAPTGVTANAICPSYTDTPLVHSAVDGLTKRTGQSRGAIITNFVVGNPMGRLIMPDEVAAAALWLASDRASAVNGAAIAIDGGEAT